MHKHDETIIGYDSYYELPGDFTDMTVIAAIKGKDWVVIKGDSLSLRFDAPNNDHGPRKISMTDTAKRKVHKLTDNVVAGVSCNDLPGLLMETIADCTRTHFSARADACVEDVASFLFERLHALCTVQGNEQSARIRYDILVAGYDRVSSRAQIYRLTRDMGSTIDEVKDNYAFAGAKDALNRALASIPELEHEIAGNGMGLREAEARVDDLIKTVSDNEATDIASGLLVDWHVGGDITGWIVTSGGVRQLAVDNSKRLLLQVNTGDYPTCNPQGSRRTKDSL